MQVSFRFVKEAGMTGRRHYPALLEAGRSQRPILTASIFNAWLRARI
jgi:hypothetical protein